MKCSYCNEWKYLATLVAGEIGGGGGIRLGCNEGK
jgi:hypothetical protein